MKVIEGKLFRNTELFGTMDPFVVITHKGVKYKTKVIAGGGRRPVWNDTFEIPLDSHSDELLITCFDEDILQDDFVGEKIYLASQLCNELSSLQRSTLELEFKGKKAADILIEAKIVATNIEKRNLRK